MVRGVAADKRTARRARLRARKLLLTLLLLAGICVMLYPVAVRIYNQYLFVKTAEGFAQAMDEQPNEEMDAIWNEDVAYNVDHRVNNVVDPFGDGAGSESSARYNALLNPMGDGQMGYIDIPRIGQQLNIYHGSDEEALLKGVGHLEGTSLPVGGSGTRCVLSAHRGLPAAKLFTDLDQLQVGDMVYLHILNRTLAYAVDGTQVVEPTQVEALSIEPGEDLLTLITCTPYAVNTHRLLVNAHAVAYSVDEDETGDMGLLVRLRLFAVGVGGGAIIALVGIVIVRLFRARQEAISSARHLKGRRWEDLSRL